MLKVDVRDPVRGVHLVLGFQMESDSAVSGITWRYSCSRRSRPGTAREACNRSDHWLEPRVSTAQVKTTSGRLRVSAGAAPPLVLIK